MTNNQDGRKGSNEFVTRGSETPDVAASTRSVKRELKTLRSQRDLRIKKPTRLERTRKLHDVVVNLVQELQSAGFASVLSPPGPITIMGPEVEDPKTQGKIGHTREPLGIYIQRLSVEDNFFQRPPFDHLEDKIYRRLIRDFIEGAAMPESKVAALGLSGGRCASLGDEGIRYSVIDGLQRLYCFCIAILVVWQRDKLLQERSITQAAWDYLKDVVEKLPDPKAATEDLLKRATR